MSEWNNNSWTENTQTVAEYVYKNEFNYHMFTVIRGWDPFFEEKVFKIEWNLDHDTHEPIKEDPVLYKLPELIASTGTIYFVEGEKDVETLLPLLPKGATATTTPFGSKSKWDPEWNKYFEGRNVVFFEDNDKSGRDYVKKISKSIRSKAKSVKLVSFRDYYPGFDITDYLALPNHKTVSDLIERAENIPGASFVTANNDARVADNIAAILKFQGREIFSRAGRLTTIDNGRFVNIERPHLRDWLSGEDFLYKKGENWIPGKIPVDAIDVFLSRISAWPEVVGISSCPTISRDGKLIAREGFDEASGIYFWKLPAVSVPAEPSASDAKQALETLHELLGEFCFVSSADKAVALSALMTPVLRPGMRVAPFHIVTAPTPGSGKSYLVSLAGLLATGDDISVMEAGESKAELDKRLDAALLAGESFITLDNATKALNTPKLCQVVEQPRISVRRLGLSESVSIRSIATIFATGNNLHVDGDMSRRSIVCQLDTKKERPEEREFVQNPRQLIRKNRGKYISAILTIALAFRDASCDVKPVASFEDWNRLVRKPLILLGVGDPVETMKRAREDNPELERISSVLSALKGIEPKTAKEIAEISWTPDLESSLMEIAANSNLSKINSRRLGVYLSSIVNRPVFGLRLRETKDKHKNQKVFFVEEAA